MSTQTRLITVLAVFAVLFTLLLVSARAESPTTTSNPTKIPPGPQPTYLGAAKLLAAYPLADGGSVVLLDDGSPHHFVVKIVRPEHKTIEKDVPFPYGPTPDNVRTSVCGGRLHVFYASFDAEKDEAHAYHFTTDLPDVDQAFVPLVCK